MRSLSKYRNLYRASWVNQAPDDVRVIHSDENLEEMEKMLGMMERTAQDSRERDEEMSFGGLSPEAIDGLFEDGESIIKAMSSADEEAADTDGARAAAEARARDMLAEAEERLAMARSECAEMFEAAVTDIEMKKALAAEEGRSAGYDDGLSRAAAEIEAAKAAIREERVKLEQEYAQLVEELEPRFVTLLTDIYEEVFKVELKELGPIVSHLLARTLHQAGEAKEFIVRVAASEHEQIISRREEIRDMAGIGQAGLEIIKDQTLPAGACLIETDGGIFDAGFDTQLKGLNDKLRLLSYEA